MDTTFRTVLSLGGPSQPAAVVGWLVCRGCRVEHAHKVLSFTRGGIGGQLSIHGSKGTVGLVLL
jgi:hypothetical protein